MNIEVFHLHFWQKAIALLRTNTMLWVSILVLYELDACLALVKRACRRTAIQLSVLIEVTTRVADKSTALIMLISFGHLLQVIFTLERYEIFAHLHWICVHMVFHIRIPLLIKWCYTLASCVSHLLCDLHVVDHFICNKAVVHRIRCRWKQARRRHRMLRLRTHWQVIQELRVALAKRGNAIACLHER